MIADAALLIFVLLPFVDWAAALILARTVRRYPAIHSLRERRNVALAIAAGTTVIALLALNSRIFHVALIPDVQTVIVVIALAAPSAFNAVWLYEAVKS